VKARGKAKKDEARSLALVRALGALEGGAGLPGLVDLLGGWEHEGKVQLGAAEMLAAMGHPGAIDPLIAALKASEKKKDRGEYAKALEGALRAITGQEGKTGAEAWLSWRKAK
jgi:HEAT repeat protein